MKKIVLIEPQLNEDHVYKYVRMPRLGLPLLGARLKSAGYAVSLYMVKDSRRGTYSLQNDSIFAFGKFLPKNRNRRVAT